MFEGLGFPQEQKSELVEIEKFILDVLDNNVRNKNKVFDIPEAINKKAEKILKHPIISHKVNANDIWHTYNNHGINGKKLNKNSIPLRKKDVALMPYIMASPTRIEKGTGYASGVESIRYIKEISNGTVIVVERQGRFNVSEMEQVTMWAEIKKGHSTNVSNARNTRPLNSTSKPTATAKAATRTVIIGQNDIAKIKKDFEPAKNKSKNNNPGLGNPELLQNGVQKITNLNVPGLGVPEPVSAQSMFEGLGLPSPKKERLSISTENFKEMSSEDLRNFTAEYYKKKLKGNTAKIENYLSKVEFISKSANKLKKPMYKEKAAVIEHLEELIENSKYNNFGSPDENDAPTTIGYLNFKSKLIIDGENRYVRIAIRLDKDRSTKFKSYDVGMKKSVKLTRVAAAKSQDGQVKPISNNKNTKKYQTTKNKRKKNNPGLGQPDISEIPVTETIVISTEPVIPVTATPGKIINPAENCTEIPKNDTEVSQNNTQNPEIKPEVSKPVKSRLMSMEFESLEMDEGWEDFMQEPAANMKLAIFGKPKNGKTAGALQFAKYLTKHGNVLYNFADQGFNKNTQDLWVNAGFVGKRRI